MTCPLEARGERRGQVWSRERLPKTGTLVLDPCPGPLLCVRGGALRFRLGSPPGFALRPGPAGGARATRPGAGRARGRVKGARTGA